MKTSTHILVPTLLAAAALPAHSENTLNIDDFKAGTYHSSAYRGGATLSASQTGDISHIIGGTRAESTSVCASPPCAANPFNQYSSFAIGVDKYATPNQHALVQTAGFYAAPRLELAYGAGSPLFANFAAYDRIRVNFIGLTQTLNFNLLMYTGARFGQNGCNVAAFPGTFSVEFLFSGFSQPGGAIDFGNINYLDFIFQDGSAIGGVSYGISSIEASDTHRGNAIECSLL